MTTFACVVCRIPRSIDALLEVGDIVLFEPGLGLQTGNRVVVCRPGFDILKPGSCWAALGGRMEHSTLHTVSTLHTDMESSR